MTSVESDLTHLPSIQIVGEVLPAYVTNSGNVPPCSADTCGQPAAQIMVLTFPRRGSLSYHLPVCMQHASTTPRGSWFSEPS